MKFKNKAALSIGLVKSARASYGYNRYRQRIYQSLSGKVNGKVPIDMTSLKIADINDVKTCDDFKKHLWYDDFFSIDDFKTSRLIVERGEILSESEYNLTCNLTIKNITHPLTFRAKLEILTDFLYSTGEIVIDRTLYNICYDLERFFQ